MIERLHLLLMRWFDALAPHRAVAGQMLAEKLYPSHPHHWAPLIFNLSRTIHWLLDAAGDDSAGRRRQLIEIGLTGIFLATLRVWTRDESEGQTRTRDFLSRRLEAGDRLLAAGYPRGTVPPVRRRQLEALELKGRADGTADQGSRRQGSRQSANVPSAPRSAVSGRPAAPVPDDGPPRRDRRARWSAPTGRPHTNARSPPHRPGANGSIRRPAAGNRSPCRRRGRLAPVDRARSRRNGRPRDAAACRGSG